MKSVGFGTKSTRIRPAESGFGLNQSGYDLESLKELPFGGGREFEVLNPECVIDALDDGHTIQINSKTGDTLTVGDKTYALVRFPLPRTQRAQGKCRHRFIRTRWVAVAS